MNSIKLHPCILALILLPIALTLSTHRNPPAAGDRHPAPSPSPPSQERLGMSSESARGRRNSTRTSDSDPGRNPEQQSTHQQRVLNYLKGHGRFNSDTSTCANIESRSCNRISECRGCLGLYTCNIPLAKCELKGVSKKTGGFIQNALEHWMAELSE